MTLLTTAQAAGYLGVCRSTLKRWRLAHCGPAYVRFPSDDGRGEVRYDMRDLDTWLERSKVRGPAASKVVLMRGRS